MFNEGYAWHTGEGRSPDLEKALKYYAGAIKANPDLFEAYSNTGLIYVSLEEYKNAKSYLGEAIRLAREREDIDVGAEAKVSSDFGTCYYQLGDYRGAEKWFRAAIRKDPGLVEARYNLINLMFKEGRQDEAKAAMLEAERLAPSARYGVFEGRLKGSEGSAAWSPLWVKILAGALVLTLIFYIAYAVAKGRTP